MQNAQYTHFQVSWYPFLLEAVSTPGPRGGQKIEVNGKSSYPILSRTLNLAACSEAVHFLSPAV